MLKNNKSLQNSKCNVDNNENCVIDATQLYLNNNCAENHNYKQLNNDNNNTK